MIPLLTVLYVLVLGFACCTPKNNAPPVTVNVGSQATGTQTTGLPFDQWLDQMGLNLSITRATATATTVGQYTCFIENAQFASDGGALVTLSGTGPTASDAMKNYVALIAGKRMTYRDPTSGATLAYTVPFNLQP